MPESPGEAQGALPELVRRQSESGYLKLLGLTVEEARLGYCRVTCTVRPELIHEGKMMNGGVMATMADVAVAMALLADPELQIPVPTIQLSISYLQPARLGEFVAAEAHIVRRGKHVGFGEVDITTPADGKLIAKAAVHCSVRPRT